LPTAVACHRQAVKLHNKDTLVENKIILLILLMVTNQRLEEDENDDLGIFLQ
jgi:hypothetical protein